MADPVTDTALATAATKGAADAGEGAAAGGLGSFFGDLFGGGAADAAAGGAGDFLAGAGGGIGSDAAASGAGAATAAGDGAWAFNPGFTAGDLGYLGGDTAAAGTGGFDAATAAGGSAFDPATTGSAPGWLGDATTTFGTGFGAPAADFSGGVGSFNAPGVSSFADTMAAGGSGPVAALPGGGGADFAGAGSAFTPGPDIALPDAASLDPTSMAASGDASIPQNATFTSGTNPATTDLSGLDAAQSAAANQYGAVTANSVPAAAAEGGAAAAAPAAGTAATTPAAATAAPAKTFLGMEVGKPTLTGAAGLALSGGLLASNLFKNSVPGQDQVNAVNSTIPQIQSTIDNVNQTAAQLRSSTQPLTAEAQQMMSYVSKGTLPPAMQAQVQAGVQAAKAQAASVMAQHGLSADPTRNAQLKQQFDTIDSQAIQLQGTLAQQLYQSGIAAIGAANQTQSVAANLQNTGIQALGLTNNTYLALQKIYADQDKTQQAAIANFAGALGKLTGGGGGTTIKIGS